MGITGLLPLLKSIQADKHLSDFAGQTLAVDAYGWLHRGTYACANDLAQGKPTTKYVEFAMQRVRLLRHHRIEPYIVFDGGPLPAKAGTEDGRRQRRAESLARGKAFVAQGKPSLAREQFVKSVDVTPQMAYQLIKALKTESVPYIVAPYEADAQMAYLERMGLVDGIITEDSDLLVFGCKKVLYKLDTVSSTITSISRDDFASVDSAQNNGISFQGWTDSKFRAMAVLSGCDYLPSIPGIGLKTAWSLLKKHGTVEKIVRHLKLEGKKPVPDDYLVQYKMAEKCFLHQRVYDPVAEEIVHLHDVVEPLSAETDAYMGQHLDRLLAKKLAAGDIDPITLLPMVDIQPTYMPKSLKTRPLSDADMNRKGKGKAAQDGKSGPPSDGGIMRFFGPKAANATPSRTVPVKQGPLAGFDSGKRTLADTMDHDLAAKKRRKSDEAPIQRQSTSRFFSVGSSSLSDKRRDDGQGVFGRTSSLKENDFAPEEDLDDISSVASREAAANSDSDQIMDDFETEFVAQEDGYISPTSFSDLRWETPDLSSPPRKPSTSKKNYIEPTFDVETVPTPSRPSRRRPTPSPFKPTRKGSRSNRAHEEEIVEESSPPGKKRSPSSKPRNVIDLTEAFEDDIPEEALFPTIPRKGKRPDLGLPEDDEFMEDTQVDDAQDIDSDTEGNAIAERTRRIAEGWQARWGFKPVEPLRRRPSLPLRRHETTVTPTGKQSGRNKPPRSEPRSSNLKFTAPKSSYDPGSGNGRSKVRERDDSLANLDSKLVKRGDTSRIQTKLVRHSMPGLPDQ